MSLPTTEAFFTISLAFVEVYSVHEPYIILKDAVTGGVSGLFVKSCDEILGRKDGSLGDQDTS